MPIHHLQADEIATPRVFDYAYDLIEESGIVDLIEAEVAAAVRGSGRPRTGLAYSIRAVLVAMVMLTYRRRPVTHADIVRTILDLTREQLDAVDMTLTAQQAADLRWGVIDARREYGRFHGWWDRITAVLEPYWDVPRRRITVEAFKEVMDRRTDEDWARSRHRWEILQQLCNLLLRASIDTITPMPGATYGIDETTLMAAAPDRDLGTQPGKKRAAMPAAGYFTRDRGVVVEHADGTKSRGGDKRGVGVGVTAMSRFGPRHNLVAAAPVYVAVEFGLVTSGDPAPPSARSTAPRPPAWPCPARRGGRTRCSRSTWATRSSITSTRAYSSEATQQISTTERAGRECRCRRRCSATAVVARTPDPCTHGAATTAPPWRTYSQTTPSPAPTP